MAKLAEQDREWRKHEREIRRSKAWRKRERDLRKWQRAERPHRQWWEARRAEMEKYLRHPLSAFENKDSKVAFWDMVLLCELMDCPKPQRVRQALIQYATKALASSAPTQSKLVKYRHVADTVRYMVESCGVSQKQALLEIAEDMGMTVSGILKEIDKHNRMKSENYYISPNLDTTYRPTK